MARPRSPPALAEFHGDLYCVYQKAGTDGYMGWTKLPITSPAATPNPGPAWVEAKGKNSYRYYKLDNTATGGGVVTGSAVCEIPIEASFWEAIKPQGNRRFPRELFGCC